MFITIQHGTLNFQEVKSKKIEKNFSRNKKNGKKSLSIKLLFPHVFQIFPLQGAMGSSISLRRG